ncbi:hypothetical protein ABZU76_25765 [Amycolatopsis sp. NPDC005232]|uniref:hypothetical protein n=1 Tax=unclassified Amycolatopsis TaxID=2618356 RepID=UPI001C6A5CAD|nr:hypothetical protein [Amycolatopsis sp. DSM 110486]QYN21679.1 hypothetical protein K1T34_03815 [Amycolatopsis sp. DSM 110486]
MTTVPLTAAPGDNTTASVSDEDEATSPPPASTDAPSVGIVELSERVVASILTRFPWLYRAGNIMLAVFAVVCLVAVGTRLSALPLIPLPLFALAWYFLRFLRVAETRRLQLRWALLTALATMVGFWLISVVARWVSS